MNKVFDIRLLFFTVDIYTPLNSGTTNLNRLICTKYWQNTDNNRTKKKKKKKKKPETIKTQKLMMMCWFFLISLYFQTIC